MPKPPKELSTIMQARPPYDDPAIVYRQKLRSPREAVALVRARTRWRLPLATGQPAAFLTGLAERKDYRDLHDLPGCSSSRTRCCSNRAFV